MITLTEFIQAIGCALLLLGSFLMLRSIIAFVRIGSATVVPGRVVDHVQEYTSRGFIWKAKVAYVFNGEARFHVMSARTLRRGSDEIKLYLTKRGRVVEKEFAIESLVVGIIAIAIAAIIFSVAAVQV